MSDELTIKTFCLGDWMTNCYVVSVGKACWIVDAGFYPDELLAYVGEAGLTVEKVVLTHAHVDHIAGLSLVREAYPDVPIMIHEAEQAFLTTPELNLSVALPDPVIAPTATDVFRHGDTLTLGGIDFNIRHTPGHSPGGVCLYQQENSVALVGDTLFAGSIGRYDFPTSDGQALLRGIREQLLTLPDKVRVLPGHGPETTIGRERVSNPYLQG